MSASLMRETLAMKTWAVVGASDDPAKFGHRIFKVLRDFGHEVYPIHPTLEEIDGVKCYARLSDLPVVPEVIDMVVNPRIGRRVFDEIAALGVRYVWMQPGTRSDEIRAFAKEKSITLIEDCVLVRIGRKGPDHG
jgi:predicted CoA-binding protein